jgi:hypothetical protein
MDEIGYVGPGAFDDSYADRYDTVPFAAEKLKSTVLDLIQSFCTTGGRLGPEGYRFNLYEFLGIPSESILTNASLVSETIAAIRLPCTNSIFHTSPGIDYVYASDLNATPGNPGIHKGLPFTDIYKIHLMVKHEYILYAVLKLDAARRTYAFLNSIQFQMKFSLNSRYHSVTAADTVLVDDTMNGGSSPTIVIYLNNDPAVLRGFLTALMSIFSVEEQERMGLMEDGEFWAIPPFNIRISKMIAYTAGDRVKKLDQRVANRAAGKGPVQPLPPWIREIQDRCPGSATYSKKVLGRNVCDLDLTTVPCYDNLCYFRTGATEVISPFEFVPMEGGRKKQKRKTRRSKRTRRRKSMRR